MQAEELRPIFDVTINNADIDQPDPEPDIAPLQNALSQSRRQSLTVASPHTQRPKPLARNFPWDEAWAPVRQGSSLLGKPSAPQMPTAAERKTSASAAKQSGPIVRAMEGLQGSDALRVIMVTVLTALCSLNMISLTAAKRQQGSFKFEYVTVTLAQEFCKLTIASICVHLEVRSGSGDMKAFLTRSTLGNTNFLQYGIPGLLYCFDNNFQYVILGFLQPAELAILWNFKIFATTLLLHAFLNRRYSRRQWLSMAMLVFGCAATQASDLFAARSEPTALHIAANGAVPIGGHFLRDTVDHVVEDETVPLPSMVPPKLIGVGLAFFGSSIAASGNVFCEYLVKDRLEDSIHLQNMQLYFFGVLLNFATLIVKAITDTESPIHGPGGFFAGYNSWVWLVILVGSISGIAVSVTLKYVDNIAVIFAHALSMVVVAVASAELFGVSLSVSFVSGGAMVLAALCMFYSDTKEGSESRGGGKDIATKSLLGSARSQSLAGQTSQETLMYCLDTGF
jgi:drug/metabolite transporter (DMT)-like permease